MLSRGRTNTAEADKAMEKRGTLAVGSRPFFLRSTLGRLKGLHDKQHKG